MEVLVKTLCVLPYCASAALARRFLLALHELTFPGLFEEATALIVSGVTAAESDGLCASVHPHSCACLTDGRRRPEPAAFQASCSLASRKGFSLHAVWSLLEM